MPRAARKTVPPTEIVSDVSLGGMPALSGGSGGGAPVRQVRVRAVATQEYAAAVKQMATRARARQASRADVQRQYVDNEFLSVDNGSDW